MEDAADFGAAAEIVAIFCDAVVVVRNEREQWWEVVNQRTERPESLPQGPRLAEPDSHTCRS